VNARREIRGAALVVLAALVAAASAAPPLQAKLLGGKVEHRAAADPAVEAARLGGAETVWLAWTVAARGSETICGFGRGSRAWGMALDEDESSWGTRDDAPQIAVSRVEIYAAVRGGQVRQLQFASEGCPVQAGERRVVWLDGITPAASVGFVARLAERRGGAKGDDEIAERALAGLAFHADPAAPLALVHLGREGVTEELRAQSLFWLAQTGEPRAARWIREAIARDPASEVREQGVFALSQLADGTTELLAILRESGDREVKRQAIFWLGQSDDPRATAELERLLTR
jgi:hypothetical protein